MADEPTANGEDAIAAAARIADTGEASVEATPDAPVEADSRRRAKLDVSVDPSTGRTSIRFTYVCRHCGAEREADSGRYVADCPSCGQTAEAGNGQLDALAKGEQIPAFDGAPLYRPPGDRALALRAQTSRPGFGPRLPRFPALARTATAAVALLAGSGGRGGRPKDGATAELPQPPLNAMFVAVLAVLAIAAIGLGYILTRDDSTDGTSAVVAGLPTAVASAAQSPEATATLEPTVAVTATATVEPTATPQPTATTVVVAAPPPTSVSVPTATPPPPTATPVPPNLVAGIGPIGAISNPASQTTTYTVINAGPGLTFTWAVSEICGTVTGNGSNAYTWNHPHPPCTAAADHPGAAVQVIVEDGAGNRVLCTYQGAAQGAGPGCQPF